MIILTIEDNITSNQNDFRIIKITYTSRVYSGYRWVLVLFLSLSKYKNMEGTGTVL